MKPVADPAAPLGPDEAASAFAVILDGGASDGDIAGFLVALSDRGETAIEITAGDVAEVLIFVLRLSGRVR